MLSQIYLLCNLQLLTSFFKCHSTPLSEGLNGTDGEDSEDFEVMIEFVSEDLKKGTSSGSMGE